MSKKILLSFLVICALVLMSCGDSANENISNNDSEKNTSNENSKLLFSITSNDGKLGEYYVYNDDKKTEYVIEISKSDELQIYSLIHFFYNEDDTIQYQHIDSFYDYASSLETYTPDKYDSSDYKYEYSSGRLMSEGNDNLRFKYYYKDDEINPFKREYTQNGTLYTESFEYDENGNKIKMVDNWDTITYKYDDSGNLLKEDRANSNNNDITYKYDESGNCISKTIGGQTYPYAYVETPAESRVNLDLISGIFTIADNSNNTTETSVQEVTESNLLEAFLDNKIKAYGNEKYGKDEFYASDLPITDSSNAMDGYSHISWIDIDNDKEDELYLKNEYGDVLILDAINGEVRVLDASGGTADSITYVYLSSFYWIVHYDISHSGREYFLLEQYDGEYPKASLEFLSIYSSETAEKYDAQSQFYLNGNSISISEYEYRWNEVFADSELKNLHDVISASPLTDGIYGALITPYLYDGGASVYNATISGSSGEILITGVFEKNSYGLMPYNTYIIYVNDNTTYLFTDSDNTSMQLEGKQQFVDLFNKYVDTGCCVQIEIENSYAKSIELYFY